MKLHLPKQLFTALLAAITLAAPAALTLGSAAWGASQTFTGTGNTEINTSTSAAGETITFQMTDANSSSESNNYFSGGAVYVTAADIVISDDSTTETLEGLVITNGNQNNHQVYTGSLTGNGILKKVGNGDPNYITFEGDATGFTGNMYLGSSTAFWLTFGGRSAAVAAAETSAEKGIAGTGDVFFSTSNSRLSFNYSASENPVYITNAISESSACTSTVYLKGGANYIFTKSVAVDTIDIAAETSWTLQNSRIFNTEGGVKGSGTLIIDDGATAEIAATKAIQSHVQVNGGGTLKASVVDGTWYDANGSTKSITLAGTSDAKMATFEVTARQTFITPTYMNGYAQISGSGSLQLYTGATFTVSGTNNIISTALTTSRASVFDIAEGGTLEISGQITRNLSNVDNDSITKKGAGELIFSNANNSIQGGLIIEAGEVTIADGGKINIYGSISNAGTLSVDGTLNVSEPANFDLNIVGYSSSSSDYNATKDNGYGYSTEIIIADGAVTIGANGTVTGVDSYRIDEEKGLIGETNTNMLRSSHFYVNTGTVKLGTDGYTDFTASTFVVKTDAILNINGKVLSGKAVELGSGATLANGIDSSDAGAEVGQGKAQLQKITLTGDATVHAQSDFGLLASAWGETRLNLNGQTLSKEGTGKFFLVQTTVEGGGKIVTSAGTLQIGCTDSVNEITTANNVVFSTTEGGTLSLVNGGKLIAQGVEGTAGTITGAAGTTLQLESTASHEYQGSVTGGFNLIKKGTGTQTFSGATSLGAVTVEAGTLAFGGGVSGAPLTHSIGTLNAANGTLSLAENTKLNLNGGTLGTLNLTGSTENAVSLNAGATLTVTSALSGLTAGSVTLGEGSVLDLSGINVGNVFGMATQSVSGAGTVKYAGAAFNNATEAAYRVSWRGTDALNFATDVEVANGIALNTYGNSTNKNILSSKNLTVGGELRLESGARLSVSAGSVSAGTIGLGHTQQGNPGHIEMTGGSITTGGITKTNSNDTGNTLTMSGGVLEITSASGIASGIQTTISGGTLKATNASWAMSVVSLGNAAFDIAAGQSITVNGSYDLTGTLTLTGNTVTENETTTTGTLVLGGTMNVTDTGLLERGDGSYSGAASNGNGFFTGNYYLVKNTDNAVITTTGLSVTLGGEAVASENVSLSETGNHLLLTGVRDGIFYVTSGEEVAKNSTVNTEGYVRHHVGSEGVLVITPDENTLSTTNAQNALLTTTGSGTISLGGNLTIAARSVSKATGKLAITSGATLTMDAGTGTKASVYDLSSFTSVELDGGTIQYHGAATTLNNVTVTENGAHITFRDVNDLSNAMTLAGTTTLNGTLTLDTLSNDPETTINAWKYGVDIARLTGSGTLDIHSTDYSDNGGETARVSIQELSGFTGAISLSKHVGPAQLNLNNLSGTLGLKTIAMDGGAQTTLSVNAGTEATMATVISGNGSVTKQGAGTLTLSGTNTYTGSTTVESGTLQIAGVSAISSSSSISISSGAELKYTGSGSEMLGKTLSGAGSFTMAGTGTLTVNTTLSHTGGTTIESGTLKQGSTSVLGEGKNVTVKNGATLDVNGKEAYYNLTLGGGDSETAAVLTNTGGGVGDGNKQLYSITLADDATVTGTTGMCMIAGSHGQASLNLAGNTLTKTGSNTFTISRATVSEGTIKVLQGNVLAKQAGSSGSGSLDLSAASVYVGNQGDSFGTFELDSVNQSVKDLTFDGGKVSTLHEKTLTATGTTQVKSTGGTLSGNLTATNKVSFENGGALKLGTSGNSGTSGKLKVQNAEDSAQYIELSGAADTAASMTAKSASSQLARLQEDASFTIQDMTLTNTTITAATPTTQVNFSNVTVAGATVLRNMQASMTGANVAAGGSEGVKGVFTASTSLLSGITLANTGDAVGSTITVDLGDLSCAAPMGPGKYDLSITLSGFTMQDYTQGIVFAADSWLGQLLTAQGATAYVSGAVETPASVSEGGSTGGVSVSYSAATGGNVGTVITITGLNVPEPATSTLSLLALAALAARRRRK